MYTRIALTLLLAFSAELASATTYYVDSSAGDDNWSGKLSVKNGQPGTDGPWATLNKVSNASLVAGDSVLFKCGQRWNESLRITSSGVSGNPISFGVYPAACSTPPEINGGTPVPASNWTNYRGNIYTASLPLNYITNSTFDSGIAGWGKASQNNSANLSLGTNCQTSGNNCLTFTSGTTNSLAISPYFELTAGNAYQLKFSAVIPAGKSVYAIVRRHGTPYDTIATPVKFTGTGAWQSYAYPFRTRIAMQKARFDLEVPAAVTVSMDNVRLETTATNSFGIFENGYEVNVAHHPNRGYDPSLPESLFYKAASNSDLVSTQETGSGSSYLVPGTDLILPAGATLPPGTGIRIRTRTHTLNERTVASYDGTRITLDKPTGGQILKGWGYFLLGQLWMLDEPRESYFDTASGKAYIWMSDSQAPGDRVRIGQLDAGIDISNASYVTVSGLAIRNFVAGVRVTKSKRLTISNMVIEDVLGRGVDGSSSEDITVSNSRIARTGRAAVSGLYGGFGLTRFSVINNDIIKTGVKINLAYGQVYSLPIDIGGTVQLGDFATVHDNRIRAASYIGIQTHQGSSILNNHIEDACMQLDDCGAIYLTVLGKDSVIQGNTIERVHGSPAGRLSTVISSAQGIYLDDLTANVTVTGNTVRDADNGMQIINASHNTISGNTFYQNRRSNIWMQGLNNRANPDGDLFDNAILGNFFSPSAANDPPIRLETGAFSSNSIPNAANYDKNRYFTILTPTMASEYLYARNYTSYNLNRWQSATTSDGVPRHLDPQATEVSSATTKHAIYRTVSSTNLIQNGNLANGRTGWGWSSQNNASPQAQLNVIDCTLGKCLQFAAGGSPGSIISPKFSVIENQWYRLSFDVLSSAAGQALQATLRRGGGGTNGYESLDPLPHVFTGSTTWQRNSLLFKALKTVNANDPITKDLGARIDFEGVKANVTVTLANVELIPISDVDQTLHTNLLVNADNTSQDWGCPFTGNQASLCNQVYRFSDSQLVTWPLTVQAHESEIIYTLDPGLVDADGDGIADSQDACADTPQGLVVNARGCSMNQ